MLKSRNTAERVTVQGAQYNVQLLYECARKNA